MVVVKIVFLPTQFVYIRTMVFIVYATCKVMDYICYLQFLLKRPFQHSRQQRIHFFLMFIEVCNDAALFGERGETLMYHDC